MADFALGLAKTAVDGTLTRALSAIDEENKLKDAAKQDLVYITGEFQMMQAFLKVANKERANNNEVVKTWVRQLRDLAFDVEDCVEFVIHLDNNLAWAWMWRMVPSFMAPPRTRDLDRAVDELKQLKARVEDVSQRNTRYNLISDSGPSTPLPAAAQIASASPSTVDILTELWAANMKKCGFCDLQDLITMTGSDRKVISMWRSAGAEHATAHIISVAYSEQVTTQEFEVHARVKLMHPFHPDEFLKNLLNQLYISTHQENRGVDLRTKVSHLIQGELRELLVNHRYLIILEDLSSSVEWDFIKLFLPDLQNGSRVIISTEQLGAALSCTGTPYLVSELRQFPDGQYLHVFFKKCNISIAEFVRQLGQRRVISLLGAFGDTSSLVRDFYNVIRHNKDKGFMGIKFQEFCWLDMTHPFNNIAAFYRRFIPDPEVTTYGDFTSDEDISIDEDTKSDEDMLPDISANHRTMAWLVVINGLQSREEWDSIKDTLVPEGTRSCIVILSDKADLVTYCAQDDSPRAIKQEWKEANAAISPFTKADIPIAEILRQLELCSVVAFWGVEGEVSSLVRDAYQILKDHDLYRGCVKSRIMFEKFFWIDVPRPFNGPAFMKRLLDDAFKKARNIDDELREDAWLIVINGVRSREEWKSIKDSLVPEGTKSCIVIISNEKDVATYCQNGSPRVIHEEHKKAYAAILPFSKGGDFYAYTPGNGFRVSQPKDSHIFFSRRLQDASMVPFVASQNRVRADIYNYAIYNGTGVVTVWGATGVGKSAIVRCSYYAEIGFSLGMTESDEIPMRFGLNKVFFQDDRTKDCQFERFGWVDVPCPFDLDEFSRRLFLDFHSLDPEEMERAAVGLIQGHDPIQGCYEILRKGNYLLVIDGLQSTHDWDIIREAFLLSHHTLDDNSSVVVIATEERVAKHCVDMDNDRMINVRALEDNGALDLFQKIANDDNKKFSDSKLEHKQHILPKCGGLPKVIAAVGQASISFWENMNDELVVKLQNDPQFNHLRGLLSWMHSYFDACPDSVKPCIFYLSVFPTNCKIRRGRLLRRWISEGYCRDTVGTTAMENARRVFAELVELGILEEPTESDMCQINGFFREYIISQPMEDNLVFVLEGHCKLNSQRTGKHLTIMKNWDSDETLYGSIDVSRLRSLTVFCKWESFFISSSMLWIRVLDLEATSDVHDGHLELIFRKLLSLKFISLRGCIELRHLPCSLGGLKQLETLDISGTSIVALPAAIIKLQKIQCIRAGTTDEGWSPAAMEDDDGTVTRKPTPPQGSDGIATIPPQAAASPTEGSDGMARGPPQASTTQLEGSYGMGSGPPKEGATSPEGSDGMATNPPQAAAAATSPEGSDGMATSTPQAVAATLLPKVDSAISRLSCSMWKKSQHVRPPHNGGIEVPVGLEKISSLQTLGVVNVNSARGKDFLTGLRKFTQLLKLRVCGINRENWEQFCIGLSSHSHLECLSVRFDMDCMDNSFKPPKTLKILKLYGPISKLSEHIKDLVNLKKIDLEMTISKTEDISLFIESLRNSSIVRRICIKPTPEIGMLDLSIFNYRVFPQVLKLDCSSQSEVIFGRHYIRYVPVLIVHCSSESDLQLTGLEKLLDLKMVFLEGFYSNKLKEDLQQEVVNHANKPVLKLVKRPSS